MSKDTERAFARYEKARKRGDFEAVNKEVPVLAWASYVDHLYEVGLRYETRQGTPHNRKRAVHFYRLAAEQGHPNAQFNLGVMYMTGEGVERDLANACALFALARQDEALRDRAAGQANKLESRLTPGQRTDAKRLAAEWRARIAAAERAIQ